MIGQTIAHYKATDKLGAGFVDNSGNIYVVWIEAVDTFNTDIFFTKSIDGGTTFSMPKNISDTSTFSNTPRFAVDSNNIYIVWGEDIAPPENADFFFSVSTDGGDSFSSPKNITNTAGGSFWPQLSVDANGNIYFLWTDTSEFPNPILFIRSTDGGSTVSPPKSLFPSPVSPPQLAVDATGNVYALWAGDAPTPPHDRNILFSRSTDGGKTFATPSNISQTSRQSGSPHIALDVEGNIYIDWAEIVRSTQFVDPQQDIFFTSSTDGGDTFSPAVNIDASPCPSAQGGGEVQQLTVDDRGNIHVVWLDSPPPCDDRLSDVFFSRSTDAGVTFSVPINISAGGGNSDGNPELVVDGSGNANIVWPELATDFTSVDILFSRTIDGGLTFSPPQNISNASGFVSSPRMAVDRNGTVFVVWTGQGTVGFSDIFFVRSPASFSLTQAIQNLISTVQALNMKLGLINSLDSKLYNALAALETANAGQRQDAVQKIMAFIHEIEAQRDKAISSSDADLLVEMAMNILNLL